MLLIGYIVVFIVLIILPFGLSFLFKKNKAVKITLQIISGLFLIWFIYDSVGKNSIERKGEKEIVGTYKLNIDSSRLHNINLKTYSDLTLTVKSNNTFFMNRQTSFLKSTTGKWNLHDDGGISFIEYQFDNEQYSHQMSPYNFWTFGSNNLINVQNDDKIIFTR